MQGLKSMDHSTFHAKPRGAEASLRLLHVCLEDLLPVLLVAPIGDVSCLVRTRNRRPHPFVFHMALPQGCSHQCYNRSTGPWKRERERATFQTPILARCVFGHGHSLKLLNCVQQLSDVAQGQENLLQHMYAQTIESLHRLTAEQSWLRQSTIIASSSFAWLLSRA